MTNTGLDVRIRKATQRAREVQPRVGSDDYQGDEACCRDQVEEGEGFLQEQVSCHFPGGVCRGGQDGKLTWFMS